MGLFRKLATRALEIDMPVMDQVFGLEPNWVLLYLFEYICFHLQFAFGFVYCIWCGKKFLFLLSLGNLNHLILKGLIPRGRVGQRGGIKLIPQPLPINHGSAY
jgi:hypothetical protein